MKLTLSYIEACDIIKQALLKNGGNGYFTSVEIEVDRGVRSLQEEADYIAAKNFAFGGSRGDKSHFNKIAAIKDLRQARAGLGLVEAKKPLRLQP